MRCQPTDGKAVYNWLKKQQHCLLCDEACDSLIALCGDCEAELPWLGNHCLTCALPLPCAGLNCGACLKQPPNFSRVEAAWRYSFPIDSLITRFKHQAQWPLGRLLGELMSHHLHHAFTEGLSKPDLLLPVPLSRQRLRQRGFNQALMLANWLSQHLQLPVAEHLLRRSHDTPAQQSLNATERKRNLRSAFAIADNDAIKGKHVALVDDVLTTGATAESLACLLRKKGAIRVDVYCLARTPKPGED
jgi:ComF family protein